MHMASKKNINSAELETMRTSRSPTTVMTANGEVQTGEEATENVKQLNFFVKVMLLEETLAVLSMEKLCEDHGFSYHWTSGQTRCKFPQKYLRNAEKYKAIYYMTCQTGCRNLERIWWMKVLQQSLGETQSKEVKTFPSPLMNFQWSREQKWNRVRVGTVYIRTFRRTQIVISA